MSSSDIESLTDAQKKLFNARIICRRETIGELPYSTPIYGPRPRQHIENALNTISSASQEDKVVVKVLIDKVVYSRDTYGNKI